MYSTLTFSMAQGLAELPYLLVQVRPACMPACLPSYILEPCSNVCVCA